MLNNEMLEDYSIIHHQNRVAYYVREILKVIDYLTEIEKDQCIRAAMVHDIGKFSIPDKILFKKGKLKPEEYEIMKTHAIIGEKMICNKDAAIAKIVRHHHERWDGNGYPDELKEENIPFASRIIAVCDAFDAMMSNRPYRRGIAFKEAVKEIQRCSGTQFDPKIAEVFVKSQRKF